MNRCSIEIGMRLWATVLEPQGGSVIPHRHTHILPLCKLLSASLEQGERPAQLPNLHRLVSVGAEDPVSAQHSSQERHARYPLPILDRGTVCLWGTPSEAHKSLHCLPEDFRDKLPLCVLSARNIHHTPQDSSCCQAGATRTLK